MITGDTGWACYSRSLLHDHLLPLCIHATHPHHCSQVGKQIKSWSPPQPSSHPPNYLPDLFSQCLLPTHRHQAPEGLGEDWWIHGGEYSSLNSWWRTQTWFLSGSLLIILAAPVPVQPGLVHLWGLDLLLYLKIPPCHPYYSTTYHWFRRAFDVLLIRTVLETSGGQ